MRQELLNVGLVGLGGAGLKVLSSFTGVEGVRLAAASDTRAEARSRFEATYNRPAYASVESMCRSSEIDAIYVATPTPFHCDHSLTAIAAGKHVICEKPMATRLSDCDRIITAAQQAGVLWLQAHSKVFDAPIRAMRDQISRGMLGDVFQCDTWNFNDWMRRPRLESELNTDEGGGVVLRQGPQQVDIVRFLVGKTARTVRSVAGQRAPGICTEGNYSAFITFDGGAAATLSFNGYGHFDIKDILIPARNPVAPRPQRSAPVSPEEKYEEPQHADPQGHSITGQLPYCGLTIVSCERGVMRQSPRGLYRYTDQGCEEIPVSTDQGRAAGLIEMRDALREGRAVFPDGEWARGTLEVCLAILASAQQGQEITLKQQDGRATA